MNYLSAFFAGAFLCNCLPHLLAGVQGLPFPTPFAKPPGVGDSTPLVNFLWGSLNLAVGLILLHYTELNATLSWRAAVLAVGFVAMGASLAHHFGKVMAGRVNSSGRRR